MKKNNYTDNIKECKKVPFLKTENRHANKIIASVTHPGPFAFDVRRLDGAVDFGRKGLQTLSISGCLSVNPSMKPWCSTMSSRIISRSSVSGSC